jgi:UDP-N-acetylmuramyl pentapeptide phosphotransferase/UDP-N-acetylglucosamine-1-phosphate transferase
MAWLAVLLLVRYPPLSPWLCFLVFAYPVIEVLYSVTRRYCHNQSPSAPDDRHLHSLLKTQIIRKRFAQFSLAHQNAAVSPCIWGLVAMPAWVGFFLSEATPLVLGVAIGAFVLLYHAAYKYLSQHL